MGGIGKQTHKDKTKDDAKKKPPPEEIENDDAEDGDFATPKQDRHDEDDRPLS